MKKNLVIAFVAVFTCNLAQAQVKFGDNKATINPNSLLEMESTSKGMLLPRLTQLQRDAMTAVPEGMVVFNTTDSCINQYNRGKWNSLCETGAFCDMVLVGDADDATFSYTNPNTTGGVFTPADPANTCALYVTEDGGTWVWNGSTYITKPVAVEPWWNKATNQPSNSLTHHIYHLGSANVGTGTATGQYSMTVGLKDTALGAYSLVVGQGNVDSVSHSLVVGLNNKLYNGSRNVIVGGTTNVISASVNNAIAGGFSDTILQGAENFIAAGAFNKIDGPIAQSIVGGFGNKMLGTSGRAMMIGDNNEMFNASRSVVFGANNKDSAVYNLVAGNGNSLNAGSQSSVVVGEANKNISTSATSGRWNFTSGLQNTNSGDRSTIMGYRNLVEGGITNMVLGYEDTILSATSHYNLVSGFRNVIGDASGYNTVSGNNNFVKANSSAVFGSSNIDSANASLISGQSNTVSGPLSMVAGQSNVVTSGSTGNYLMGLGNRANLTGTSTGWNIIAGRYNAINSTGTYGASENAVFGLYDTTTNVTASIVAGNNNSLVGNRNAAVFGGSNKDSASYTLTSGNNNTIGVNGTYSSVAGQLNYIANSNNHVYGNQDTLTDGAHNNFVAGRLNKLYGGAQSYNVVGGYNNKLYGAYSGSAVFGYNNVDSASQAFLAGNGNSVSLNASYGVALGSNNKVAGAWGVALGNTNYVAGGSSGVAMGYQNGAMGNNSGAWGVYDTATGVGNGAWAIGYLNKALGDRSVALGSNLTVAEHQNVAVGRWNLPQANAIFTVGAGTSATPKNGFVVTASNTTSATVNGLNVLIPSLPVYASEAAANADASLLQFALYRITGESIVRTKL